MTDAIVLGTVGLLLSLGLLVVAGARVRTAGALPTFLFWAANVALVSAVTASLRESDRASLQWTRALLAIP